MKLPGVPAAELIGDAPGACGETVKFAGWLLLFCWACDRVGPAEPCIHRRMLGVIEIGDEPEMATTVAATDPVPDAVTSPVRAVIPPPLPPEPQV
jgi:hypothetical protein